MIYKQSKIVLVWKIKIKLIIFFQIGAIELSEENKKKEVRRVIKKEKHEEKVINTFQHAKVIIEKRSRVIEYIQKDPYRDSDSGEKKEK